MSQGQRTPVFLLIDTSTSVCSVATSLGDQILDSEVVREAQGQHAALVAPMVERLLQRLQERQLTLDAVVLSAGPGSYTGLRIGSALAKGLCHGYGIPLIPISTLEMMALGFGQTLSSGQEARIYPMIDARRMEVYTAPFDGTGQRLAPDSPYILASDIPLSPDMAEIPHYLVGDGASKADGLWPINYTVVGDFYPEARYMLKHALEAYEVKAFADLAYWTPSYLKEYVATIGRNKVLG